MSDTIFLNTVTDADQALLTEPDCPVEHDEDCEHAAHWEAFCAAPVDGCERCRYQWDTELKMWYVAPEDVCGACHAESFA